MKIAFDVGGVLSKYPAVFRPMLRALINGQGDVDTKVEVHIISDMHPVAKIEAMLAQNRLLFAGMKVHSADYEAHGEMCKAVLCEELGIDILIDDFPGYVAHGKHCRLLVMPNPHEPYYHDDWKTDGSEGAFGRRVRPTKGDHPWK